MGDFLQNAATALPLFIPRREVTYRQGSAAISINAIPGKSMVECIGEEGIITKVEMRNYLIRPEELVVDGTAITPKEGDTITDDNEGSTVTYIVSADAGAAWRWVSRYHKQYRVVVKERSEMAA